MIKHTFSISIHSHISAQKASTPMHSVYLHLSATNC